MYVASLLPCSRQQQPLLALQLGRSVKARAVEANAAMARIAGGAESAGDDSEDSASRVASAGGYCDDPLRGRRGVGEAMTGAADTAKTCIPGGAGSTGDDCDDPLRERRGGGKAMTATADTANTRIAGGAASAGQR